MTRLFDNHAHSYFSADSRMDIRDAVRTAYEKGLKGIALTDHIDYDPPAGAMHFIFDVPPQQEAIDREIEELGLNGRGGQFGDFYLLKGVEIGLQESCMDDISNLLSKHRFDCVIASLHFIDGQDPYYGHYYKPYEYTYAYSHYLDVLGELLEKTTDFDIMGHYDYVARYPEYPQACITYKEFRDQMERILSYLASNGKTFEINTKTYQITRFGQRVELDIDVLKRFKELGGEAISFGSDAHGIQHIGKEFAWAREVALAAGIEYEVYFVDRQPHYIKL